MAPVASLEVGVRYVGPNSSDVQREGVEGHSVGGEG